MTDSGVNSLLKTEICPLRIALQSSYIEHGDSNPVFDQREELPLLLPVE